MKAEQRKELETNTLADKMGQAMKRVQSSPRRTFLIYLVVLLTLSVLLFLSYRWYVTSTMTNSSLWVNLYDGSANNLLSMAEKQKLTPAGKAARLQVIWMIYWDEGVKMLGNDSKKALNALEIVGNQYADLAKDCKDDPIFEPQAMLGMAIVAETKAVQDPTELDSAIKLYDAVVKKYEKTYQGKFSQDRLDHLKDDKKRGEVESLYKDLQKIFRIQAPQPALNFPPGGHDMLNPPGIDPPKKDKDAP